MATRMQQRRGTAAQWVSTNDGNGPILQAGEIGFESDTGKFKIGDGTNDWLDLAYFVDADSLIDGAPGLLDTLNELAAAIGDDPSFFTTVATNLSNHEADTTNVHGIANTAELATKTFAAELLTNSTKSNITITGDKNGLTITAENGVADSTTDNLTEGTTNKYFTDERAQDAVGNAVGTGLTYTDATGEIKVTPNTYDAYGAATAAQTAAESYADGLATNYDAAGAAATAQTNSEGYADTAVSTHNSDTTNVHGIANTADLATKSYADGAVSTHSSHTTSVHGILDTNELATKSYVADAVTNATVDQAALAGTGIDYNISTDQFDIDSTVTTNSGEQTLTNKTISHSDNTITVQVANVSDLTATAAELNILDGITATTAELNILDGVTTTAAELNYVDGVTSSIQSQIDDKLSKTGGTMTGDITLAGAPTQALHAATKAYVDGIAEGLHIHASCVAATTVNVAIATELEPGDLVDGVTLAEGDRVLVKSQTNAAQNGIYVVQASGSALRAADFNEPLEVDGGDFVFITGGTTYDNTGWVQTTANLVTIGTDPIMFTQFSGAGTYLAGTGLELTDNVFSIDTATTVDVSTAQTLTNKTISAANNTLTIATTDLQDVTASAVELNILDGATLSTAELNILDGVTATTAEINVLDGITASTNELNYVDGVTSSIQTQIDGKISSSSSDTLTNKTVSLGSNTVTGTLAEFNNALTDADFATLAGTETLTNKTLHDPTITVYVGLLTAPVTGNEISTLLGITGNIQYQIDSKISSTSSDTLNNKTVNLSANTVSGTIAQFNTALSDADFATLAGTETLTNKVLDEPVFASPEERWTVSATAATGTINFDAKTSGILYYTTNASGNWTLNVRGDGSNTLNNMLATNDSITVVFFATNGATPFYQTGFQIDGSAVTPKWQNGTVPAAGNANSIDIYSYTIVKTGNAAFTAFGSQTRFA